MIYFV